jgi:hypothetical protein
MKSDDDTDIISMAKVIREEEHAEDARLALEKKAQKKKVDEEQTTLDI